MKYEITIRCDELVMKKQVKSISELQAFMDLVNAVAHRYRLDEAPFYMFVEEMCDD